MECIRSRNKGTNQRGNKGKFILSSLYISTRNRVFEHGMKSIIRSSLLNPQKSLSTLSSHSRIVSSSSTSQQSYNQMRKIY